MKSWDKRIATLAGGLMPLPWIVAGLGVRFGWTGSLPLAIHLVGLLAVVLGYALSVWAMAANAFLAQGVRIQDEGVHVVASGGPYRYLRLPGYAGAIQARLGTPFLLGSPWALLPAGLSAVLVVVRTRPDDRALMEELPGYRAYARRPPSHLVPGEW